MADLSATLGRYIASNFAFAAMATAIHCHALKLGNLCTLHLATRILGAYCECGLLDNARHLFDEMRSSSLRTLDLMSWNVIISGCIRNSRDQEAFHYFKLLLVYCSEGKRLTPDSYTLSSLLSSSFSLRDNPSMGEELHAYAVKTGIISSVSVGNALVTLYAIRGGLSESVMVFESMPWHNVVSWTALISGHAKTPTHEEESLRLFVKMMRDQRPNQFTFAAIFSVCGSLTWLSQGVSLISPSLKMGFLSDIHVQNSLVGFYSECGCMQEAKVVFDLIMEPDIVSWNSLLKGYSQQGRGGEALLVFEQMCSTGPMPDSITFLTVLSSCTHSGMTSEGLDLYRKMKEHKIDPRPEHVSCIVNLLGRAGHLRKAEDFLRSVKFKPGSSVWRTLLGACRAHQNSEELAESAARELLQLEPYDAEAYVVLSQIYAGSGRWNMVGAVLRSMKDKGVKKVHGFSSIEISNKVHSFVSADWAHPQIDEIVTRVKELNNNMKNKGENLLK